MTPAAPALWWLRRDLRLADNPALTAALSGGGPLIPVFVLDPETETLGAAAKWRLGQGLRALADSLAGYGSRLVLRRGPAVEVLTALAAECGARAVHWNRHYDAPSRERDTRVKSALRAAGHSAESHAGLLLAEPFAIRSGAGGPYRVFTPFWRALRARDPGLPLAAPPRLPGPAIWPRSDDLADWALDAPVARGGTVLARHHQPGEAAALQRLEGFVAGGLAGYAEAREHLGMPGCSGLSDCLSLGEIGPRQVWARVMAARQAGNPGAEAFLRQLGWRDFAWHLLYHFPALERDNWRPEWHGFGWRGDNDDARAWARGRTGVEVVDAAMRELYVTGRMHNRARMIVASYLTKHLLTDWRIGLRWFADCLTDWDAASNALGWQWVAGSGPDAAPYFRIFNPDGQAARFDAAGRYRAHWLQGAGAADWQAATPRCWRHEPRPEAPALSLAEGRARALRAYEDWRRA